MLCRLMISFCFGLLLVPFAVGQDKPVHLFILSGQSNMAGMNPESGFVPEAKKLFPDAEVVYIKVAQGGQPIRLWVDQWNDIASKYKLASTNSATKFYKPILAQYAKLTEKHAEFASVTFCWMQGERDAREKNAVAYYDALKQLTENLRRDLKQPKMNLVIGRISDFKNAVYSDWDKIRSIQTRLADDDPRGAWVDCDDLNNKPGKDGALRDDLHYTKEGYAILGRRFARQGKRLIEGQEPDSKGRPE